MSTRIANMKIAVKLPALIAIACIATGALVGGIAYVSALNTVENTARERLITVAEGRSTQLGQYFRTITDDLRTLSTLDHTRAAASDFIAAFADVAASADPVAQLQGIYITDNPHPTGEKDKLYDTGGDDLYSTAHATYHEYFHKLLNEKGYYDIFLFDLDGNLVYTVFKELDYATNLVTGKYKDTGLGKVFRAARDNPAPGYMSFDTFRAYAPSHGAPASFISTPILDEAGKLVSVLVFQMPIDRIAAVMANGGGLGETGEALLIGEGGYAHSASRFHGAEDILNFRFEVDGVTEALAGETIVGERTLPDGREVTAALWPLEFLGASWTVATYINRAETMAPLNALTLVMTLAMAGLIVVLPVVGLLAARTIVRPLKHLSAAVDHMLNARPADLSGAERGDEIGDLFRAVSAVNETGLEAARVRSALDESDALFMIAGRSGRIVYANKATYALFQKHERQFAKVLPGVTFDDFHATPLTDFFACFDGAQKETDLSHPIDLRGDLDGLSLELSVRPIIEQCGAQIGSAAVWTNRTSETSLNRSIDRMVHSVSRGDLSGRMSLDGIDAGSHSIVEGMNDLVGVIDRVTSDLSQMLGSLSAGDLSAKMEGTYRGRYAELAKSANTAFERIGDAVAAIRLATDQATKDGRAINESSVELSTQTERTAANLEETATATEQLLATVRENAGNAREASEMAATADQAAKDGGDVVKDVVAAMSEIKKSSDRVNDIIGVIEEIAFQTNLLALNASVEAARAGDSGKGFAVVASEVRTLAQRSSQAAEDIKGLIRNSTTQVDDGVALVTKAGDQLSEIVASIGAVVASAKLIRDASDEQATGIQDINTTMAEMDKVTHGSAAMAERNAAAARSLADQSKALDEAVSFFSQDAGQKAKAA